MVVYLVSREHVPVFESLGRAFAQDPDVHVLLDRRTRERRLRERRAARRREREARRAGERRRGAEREQLDGLGWVRIDPGARDLAPLLRLH